MLCMNLVSVEMHDGVEIIEEGAFEECEFLRGIIKLPGVRVIEECAFAGCASLANIEFGDKLDTIGRNAFDGCISLRSIKIPKVRNIGEHAFWDCVELTEVELSEDLETVGEEAIAYCPGLRHIALPLKVDIFDGGLFSGCGNLSTVHLVGGIHKNISSLLLGSWRNEMKYIIGRINQVLPNTPANEMAALIRRWMGGVLQSFQHYKSEHYALLKNNMTQLELALWKANLPNIDAASRVEARITCGANLIIPHVLSFLNNEDVFPTMMKMCSLP